MLLPENKAVLRSPFRTYFFYNRPYWRAYLTGALLSLFFVSIELVMPFVIRFLIDRFETGTMSYRILVQGFAALLAIAVGSGIARYWQRLLMITASRKFEYDLRNAYFHHVQCLSQDFYHRTQTGDIMARATNDLNYVRMFVGPGIMGTVDMIRIPFTFAVMLHFSTRLTLISMLPLPIVSLLVYFFVMYMHRQSKRVQDQFSVVTARTQENLAGARVVKAFGIADRELRDFKRESETYMRESIKLSIVMALAFPLIGVVIGAALLLILWKGGNMVIDGHLTLGQLSGFIVCLLMLTFPLAQFGWVLTLYQRGAVAMKRITDILLEEPTIQDARDVRSDVRSVDGAIQFENVSLAYDSQNVLEDISFEVPKGHTVAVVGPTGSGKSSIVALLTREYDPSSGRVLMDGVDARRLPVHTLRGAIGYVPQDTFLFSDSIRENIAFGRPDASEESVERACQIAQFSETVAAASDGYDTLLGERGVNLSGGQKQRLAIARAVIRDPRILILDDALSSVDTHTEEEILRRLQTFMDERTTVIISHRVSTIRHADLILVLDDGRIVERGRHDRLVVLGGLYADMYERQLLEDEIEEEA
jgi:ATP-binding cassette subfamily B protein